MTIDVVGGVFRLDQDTTAVTHFRSDHAALFLTLLRDHGATFARQAANLGRGQTVSWEMVLPQAPLTALIDGFPILVCRFARPYECWRFRGEAAFGHDELNRQPYSPTTGSVATFAVVGQG